MKTVFLYFNKVNNSVQVTVPDHQLEEWDELAEENDMSRSMFVRACVEAGRRQLAELEPTESESNSKELESDIINVVSENNGISADNLVAEVTEPIEEEIYKKIEKLDGEGRLAYSPRKGGYVVK